jgi:AraC-like DNA-binding protein
MSLVSEHPVPRPGVRHDTTAHRTRAVQRAIELMREHLGDELTHRHLARAALLSPYHFNRVFREVTGIPPLQFLYALRLAAAKRLLMTTRRSITDVCLDVGYNSLGTFISRFTRLVGQSPRQLRLLLERDGGAALMSLSSDPGEPAPDSPSVLRGAVVAPEGACGLIFIGLFPRPIPEGRPIACTVVAGSGEFQMGPVPDGRFQICAVAIDGRLGPLHTALGDDALRGRAGPVVVEEGRVSGPTRVVLRPASPTDPPILVALPLIASRSEPLAVRESEESR